MRRLIASTFASLDGIMQAPGGPEEDPTGGFTLGGWMFGYGDEGLELSASGFDGKDRELVLGRRTYEIFEAYWPYQPDDHPIARTLNREKKYVASRTLTMLHWNNSTLLRGDVVSAIDPIVALGPSLQFIRGILFATAFYPLRTVVFARRNGWRIMWLLLVVLGILAPFAAAPGSVEGLLYTRLPFGMQLSGWLEIVTQALLLSVILHYWVNHPEKKWIAWTPGPIYLLAVTASILGFLLPPR